MNPLYKADEVVKQKSRFDFNYKKWLEGRKTEDEMRPYIEKYFGCKFHRQDDGLEIDPDNPPIEIFDKLDFRNEEKKIIVEIKGRKCESYKYYETIITCGKIYEAEEEIEDGYDVYYLFKFKNCSKIIQQPKIIEWKQKITGTFSIPHYLIPIMTMKDFNISL